MATEILTSITIPLEGVKSGHCALVVYKELGKVTGIQSHKVELNNNLAVITTNGNLQVLHNVVKAIRGVGYSGRT
ncbi:MAG: heavy metal-associated domain-containing protein [Ferruginibacter sp.]